jgi:hypothetical protein
MNTYTRLRDSLFPEGILQPGDVRTLARNHPTLTVACLLLGGMVGYILHLVF